MDILDEYLRNTELSKENVLRLVDEYTLYAYYLDYSPEIGVRYTSPIRREGDKPDDKPSFTVFPSNNSFYEYLWKDHGKRDSGGIFKLIGLLTDLTNMSDILTLIDQDFELGLTTKKPITAKIVKFAKPEIKEEVVIRIKKRDWNKDDLNFWYTQGISIKTLQKYNVYPISHFWTKDSQLFPITVSGLAYGYRIADKFKIYQPFNKEYKFITNYPSNYIEGFLQLNYDNNDLLIITKSLKEVMWFKENLNIEAVAGKSETTDIPVEYINLFKDRFKRIIVFLDPDPAGYAQANKYKELYGFDYTTIHPELNLGVKDPTDHNKEYGTEKTIELVKSLLMLN